MNPLSSTDTTVTYIGDGVTTDFAFDFPYLDPSHIFVYVNDVPTAATLFAQQVERIVAPGNGVVIDIERHTPSDPVTTFSDGTVILSSDLDAAEAQARFIAEEARDLAKRGIRFNDALNAYDAKGFRISNVADPVLDTDALNLRTLQTAITAIIGTDPLAVLMATAAGYAADVAADKLICDADLTAMNADLVTATALAAAVAAGPDGATICARITAYLGSDAWLGGGGPGTGGSTITTAGAHRYWRVNLKSAVGPPERDMGWTNVGQISVSEIEFRPTAGTAHPATGGSPLCSTYNGSSTGNWVNDRNSGGGVVSHTGAFAFDGSTTAGESEFNFNDFYISATNALTWIGYAFPTAIAVQEVAIAGYTLTDLPLWFDVDYSDDAITWHSASANVHAPTWVSGTFQTFPMPFTFSNPTTAFTASGTWTKPSTGRMAYIQVWGGGGGNNGGGGGYNEIYVPYASLPATVAVTVGAGGASGAAGGTSVFAGYISATGGSPNNGSGGSPQGLALVDPLYSGGSGGGSAVYGGGGGNGGTSQHGGNAATAPGGGGNTSGAGARGEVRVSIW